MRSPLPTTLAACVALGAIALVRSAPESRGEPKMVSSGDAEIARVRAHFDSVLSELGRRDLAALSSSQRAHRAALLSTLRDYRDRGAFPKNYDFPDRPVPYFVDRKTGVRCAVARLLESTGRTDLVQHVVRTNVNVHVPELAGDTAFTGWLDASGLTLAEAARIQPAYSPDRARERRSYRLASAVTIPVSGILAVWNATANENGNNAFVGALGIAAGVASIGYGASGQLSTTDDINGALILGNYAVGAASFVLGIRALMRRGDHEPRGPATEQPNAPNGSTTSVAPIVSLGNRKALGAMVSVRF